MNKLTPAKNHLIGFIIASISLVGLLSAQQSTNNIDKENQAKLQATYREWQDSAKTTEILRLRFNNIAIETLANMGLPPKEYEISIDSNRQFIILKKASPTPTPKSD